MLYSGEASLKEKAFAKVNLALWILSKRTDGYHEILSFMHEIALYDELYFWEDEGIEVVVEGERIVEENLVSRAIANLRRFVGFDRGIKILLKKKIPMRAGLGGGSSDAAAAIRGALKLWGLTLKEEDVLRIASEIGSDVPFFMKGGFCLCSGRGEKIKRIPFVLSERLSILLVVPPYGLSTRDVYSWVIPPYSPPPETGLVIDAFKNGDWRFLKEVLRNDLERPVFERFGELKELKERLLSEGALISMLSGSGSTVFAVFEEDNLNIESFKDLSNNGFKLILTRFKGSDIYED